ncbi:unnamed protein product [Paramecium octaurelia]|uniref:2-oxoglutarate dehydrogenase, mitochondrial n=1 Tax=Paramecium octaurelia TaxID=43137 RepID=A0A8S1SRI9_PAROT|nr:unnamed protein product [Paramecium octaurelia]
MLRFIGRNLNRYNFSELQKFGNSFLAGSNAEYLDNLLDKWSQDPNSVPATWDAYFRQVCESNKFEFTPEPLKGQTISFQADQASSARKLLSDHFRVRLLINKYRHRGHEKSMVDPLDLEHIQQIGKVKGYTKLDYREYFTEEDLDREFYIHDEVSSGISKEKQLMKLRDLINYLEKAYCGKISYEYMHIQSTEERNWIREQIEKFEEFLPSKEQKLKTFERLGQEHAFSTFLQRKFNTSKRFGIEGCDSMISGLQAMVDSAAQAGVEYIVFGMAHRGRLNTLYNVFQKSPEEIMVEFQDLKGIYNEDIWGNSGDVKYHLGSVHNVQFGEKKLRLEMLPNPSHLETVDPCVYGKVRAIQDYHKDRNGDKAFGVLIHGDAAVAGQGIVYESLQMADLEGYKSGGIIHIVSNNQIGFTTVPKDSRSGLYCTDIAHAIQAPVIHVNADEPELVDKVFQVATLYRTKFKRDIFIDLVGYRRYGHNEQDQPKFTQPIMYDKIEKTPPVFVKFAEKLIAQGIVTKAEVDQLMKTHEDNLEVAYQKSRKMDYNLKDWQPVPWEMIKVPTLWGRIKDTGVPINILKQIGDKINKIPSEFNAHPQIRKFYEERLNSIQKDQGVDFATAEALAFGTLLHEGFNVRLSGEDVQRATFSHRHAVIHDQKNPNGPSFVPLHAVIPKGQENDRLSIYNSHLSEYGVLGFEYGYSITNPNTLVLWEAQFGDFANGAQIIIDNYIASAESKWEVDSGLVMLLPNGMDGQGPEHSSGRVERFLQLSDDDPAVFERNLGVRLKRQMRNSNMQIVQCTTPANYFHSLRRQLRRDFRKPLIAMTSKKLLRLQAAKSKLNEFSEQARFSQIYDDPFPEQIDEPSQIQRVILCSGQVYYDILKKREDLKVKNTAIVRIEQLAPFPYEFLQAVIQKYKKAHFVWVQEEHQNYGPWSFVRPRIQSVISKTQGLIQQQVQYIGRKPSGSPATGFHQLHEKEVQAYLAKAFEF